MVKYLNAANKTNVIILGMMMQAVGDICQALKLEGKQKGRLNSAKTHMEKCFTEIIDNISKEQAAQLIRQIHYSEIRTVPKMSVSRKELEARGQENGDTIIEYALEARCPTCPQGKLVDTCALKAALLDAGALVAREHCEKGQCPFMYKGGGACEQE